MNDPIKIQVIVDECQVIYTTTVDGPVEFRQKVSRFQEFVKAEEERGWVKGD